MSQALRTSLRAHGGVLQLRGGLFYLCLCTGAGGTTPVEQGAGAVPVPSRVWCRGARCHVPWRCCGCKPVQCRQTRRLRLQPRARPGCQAGGGRLARQAFAQGGGFRCRRPEAQRRAAGVTARQVGIASCVPHTPGGGSGLRGRWQRPAGRGRAGCALRAARLARGPVAGGSSCPRWPCGGPARCPPRRLHHALVRGRHLLGHSAQPGVRGACRRPASPRLARPAGRQSAGARPGVRCARAGVMRSSRLNASVRSISRSWLLAKRPR